MLKKTADLVTEGTPKRLFDSDTSIEVWIFSSAVQMGKKRQRIEILRYWGEEEEEQEEGGLGFMTKDHTFPFFGTLPFAEVVYWYW